MGIGCEDRVLRVGSHRIRVRVQHGDDGGLPLLLLNGVGAPLELWQPLLRHLPGVTTIAMDAPGCGGSSTPLQPLTIQGHARLAVQVLDRLGISSFSVLGFSFGGLVAQEVARLAGPRMHRLVLASTSCGWGGVPGSPRALLAINTPDRYYDRSLFEAAAPEYIGGEETANEDFLQEQARIRSAHPPNRRGYFHQCWAASIWSSLPWLCRVRTDTLVITGDSDPLVPPVNASILASMLPHAQVRTVPGGGHLCLLERARTLAPGIIDFLYGEVGEAGEASA